MPTDTAIDISTAVEQGRVCALAARGKHDLARYAAARPALFPARPFDDTLFGAIALAIGFGAPDATEAELRFTNRCVLWGFALDWLVDHVATTRDEIDRLAIRCLAVADGGRPAPDDDLGQLLAEQRDELAACPAFARARPYWRAELAKVLTAMAREWSWKTAPPGTSTPPTMADYLANADNLACTLVNVSYWIRVGDATLADDLPALVAASGTVQRALRLVNDLGTYDRDARWGDLNSIMIMGDRAGVREHLDELVDQCRAELAGLRVSHPAEAAYLTRQLGFSTGFYRLSDFWGER